MPKAKRNLWMYLPFTDKGLVGSASQFTDRIDYLIKPGEIKTYEEAYVIGEKHLKGAKIKEDGTFYVSGQWPSS